MDTINVIHPICGLVCEVSKDDYIAVKTAELQSPFGKVTFFGVRTQLDRLLTGLPWTNAIGAMIALDLPEDDDEGHNNPIPRE